MKFATATARHQRILTMLRDLGSIRGSDLPNELGVTPMTAWRDLRLLAEQGLLRRVRGGAMACTTVSGESNFETKFEAEADAKRRIAELAVREFVREGDVLALEGGTTVAALVGVLPIHRISIVTNSLPIALKIRQERPALPVQVIGGWLSAVSGNSTGPDALKSVRKTRASVCFLGATGWDLNSGPMDPNPLEIEVKRALAASARKVVLLIDSRKFGLSSVSVLLHPRRLSALVTDRPLTRKLSSSLKKEGIRILVAPSPDIPKPTPSAIARTLRRQAGDLR